jgi:hypothetical protein
MLLGYFSEDRFLKTYSSHTFHMKRCGFINQPRAVKIIQMLAQRVDGVAQVVQCFSSKHKALNSNPSIAKIFFKKSVRSAWII